MILTPSQKLPKNVEDSGKLIVVKGHHKKLPKVKKIAQSGHTAVWSEPKMWFTSDVT